MQKNYSEGENIEVETVEEIKKILREGSLTDIGSIQLNDVRELTLKDLDEIKSMGVNIDEIFVSTKYEDMNQRCEYDVDTYSRIIEKLEELVSGIDLNSPEIERFAEVYKRIGKAIVYDYPAAYPSGADQKKYSEEQVDNCRNLKNGLLEGKCVCAGYADILRNALSLVNIDSVYTRIDVKGQKLTMMDRRLPTIKAKLQEINSKMPKKDHALYETDYSNSDIDEGLIHRWPNGGITVYTDDPNVYLYRRNANSNWLYCEKHDNEDGRDTESFLYDENTREVYSVEGHACNKVKIDGQWYNVDLTWDADELRKGNPPKHALKSDAEIEMKDQKIIETTQEIQCDKTFDQIKLAKYFDENHIYIGSMQIPKPMYAITRLKELIDNERLKISNITGKFKRVIDEKIWKKNNLLEEASSPSEYENKENSESEISNENEENLKSWDLKGWNLTSNDVLLKNDKRNCKNESSKNIKEDDERNI